MHDSAAKYQRGDWIRWRQMLELAIGEVAYVRELDSHPWGYEYITSTGTVREGDVLEARHPTIPR